MVQQGDKKIWAFGEKAHAKLSEGLRKGTEVVASTLGPAASNILIERKHRTPIVVDDGYTAINNLILEDELENLGVNSLVDAANKASERAGDGTSTTIVLIQAIYEEGRKRVGVGLAEGQSPLEIRNSILSEKKIVVEALKESAQEVKSKKDIRAVAMGAYADDQMADTIADLVTKVGENGTIIVEEGWGRETEVELVTGMRFAGKLAHGLFANNAEEGLHAEGTPILVTDFDFVNLNDLMAVVKDVSGRGEPGIVIIANKYERGAIDQIIKTNVFNIQNRNPFRIYLVRTPSFTPGEFEDLAVFVGARYWSKEKGDKVLECKVEDLGRASIFKISKTGDGVAIGGAGTKVATELRIEDLKKKLADEDVKMMKARIGQRIASLASAIGIIKVASPSEGETEHIRLKTLNAVKSAQAAVEEGIVAGGGIALKEIADKLPKDSILKNALKVPYDIISKSTEGLPEVYDAVKVVRTAVEQACSQAWLLINTKTLIAFKTEPDRGDAAEIMVKKDD